MKGSGAFALLLGGALALQAQAPVKSMDQSTWLGPQRLLHVPSQGSHPNAPALMETQANWTTSNRRLPRPPRQDGNAGDGLNWGLGVHVAGGEIFFLNQVMRDLPLEPGQKRPKKSSHYEVFRFDGPTWRWEPEPCGTLDWNKGCTLEFLSPERLLAIATSSDSFVKDGRAYPFAVFKKQEDGRFMLERMIEPGLEKAAFRPDGTWAYPWMSTLWLGRKVAKSEDFTALGTGFGLFWIFDGKGSLRRVVRLYPELTEERLQRGDLWGECVLGFQPKPDGEFLIAALDGEALRRGHLLWQQTPEATTGKGFLERQDKILDQLLAMNPRVDWYVLNPLNGSLREEIPPIGLPGSIPSAKAMMDFNWVFKADGNLRLYPIEEQRRRDPHAPKTMVEILMTPPSRPAAPAPAPAVQRPAAAAIRR